MLDGGASTRALLPPMRVAVPLRVLGMNLADAQLVGLRTCPTSELSDREDGMVRIKRLILVALAAGVLALGAATPTLADKGGHPQENSCGIGAAGAHEAIADQTLPGATEFARFPPSEAGCTGSNK